MEQFIIGEFEELFIQLIEFYRLNYIAIYQGSPHTFDPFHEWLNRNDEDRSFVNAKMSALLTKVEVQDYFVNQKRQSVLNDIKQKEFSDSPYDVCIVESNKKLLSVLDWNYYYENCCHHIAKVVGISDEEFLFSILFNHYKQISEERFIDFYKDCPLDKYYKEKGVDLNMEANYGLITVPNVWGIRYLQSPKLYDPSSRTHILIRYVPKTFMAFLDNLRQKYDFDLALRPDYFICGDGIRDIGRINEELEFGEYYRGTLSLVPRLTKLYDSQNYSDNLIVHRTDTGITFEELLDNFDTDGYDVVTNMIHLQFTCEEGQEFLTHIDHEFIFYSIDEYTDKIKEITKKGTARKRYKTFKIDNARIPVLTDADNSILYQSLVMHFQKINLIDEYFGKIES